MQGTPPSLAALAGLLAAMSLVACKPQHAAVTPAPGATGSEDPLASIPLGDPAGGAAPVAAVSEANPLEGDPKAVGLGLKVFIAMNCAGCHGYGATGNMGPDLTDRYWRYGGTPADIFKSIAEGRPQGMPAWGRSIPRQDIWTLVAYIQSLGGTVAAARYHDGLQGDHDVTSVAPSLSIAADPSGQFGGDVKAAVSAP